MRERVLNYMKEFGSITTYNAFIDLGCTRLSEYIRQIRLEYKQIIPSLSYIAKRAGDIMTQAIKDMED